MLSNSRTEPRNRPQPPRASSTSESRSTARTSSSTPTVHRIGLDVDSLRLAGPQPSSPDWPSSNDDASSADDDDDAAPPSPSPVTRVRVEPSTPHKAARTTITITSPSKRRRPSSPSASPPQTRTPGHPRGSDLFSTPPAHPRQTTTYPTPLTTTPSRLEHSITSSSATTTPLSQQILALLTTHSVALPPAARSALAELTQTHELRMQGVVRGRDIARVAVRKRDEDIAGLRERVGSLEVEREGLVRLGREGGVSDRLGGGGRVE